MEIKTNIAKRLEKLPLRLHHHAYTTEDHESNRYFYEEVLGLPLIAMYVEKEFLLGEWVELGHAFYGLDDGSALVFFNFADPRKQAEWRAQKQSLFVHLSLLVDESTQQELKQRLAGAGIESFVLEHGYCTSLYTYDPNGLLLEFTVNPKNYPAIESEMAKTAHEDLRRWIAGDRTSNNKWRPEIVATEGA